MGRAGGSILQKYTLVFGACPANIYDAQNLSVLALAPSSAGWGIRLAIILESINGLDDAEFRSIHNASCYDTHIGSVSFVSGQT